MKVLGYGVVLDEGSVVGYGTNVHDMFEIGQAEKTTVLSHFVHVAFNAPNRNAVDGFYRTALENGGTCNGKPGLRPEYEEGYYAAFVFDPDGNNIEAVYTDQLES